MGSTRESTLDVDDMLAVCLSKATSLLGVPAMKVFKENMPKTRRVKRRNKKASKPLKDSSYETLKRIEATIKRKLKGTKTRRKLRSGVKKVITAGRTVRTLKKRVRKGRKNLRKT